MEKAQSASYRLDCLQLAVKFAAMSVGPDGKGIGEESTLTIARKFSEFVLNEATDARPA